MKIQKTCSESDNEFNIMKWLAGRLPVPEIIEFERKDGYNFLLMSRLGGETADVALCESNMYDVLAALAGGLKKFWSINISDCPFNSSPDIRLKVAEYNVSNNLVDVDDFNEDTLGAGGFGNVGELLDFLKCNRPSEELYLTHGDYCFPNVFLKNRRAVGFIDFGKAGIADRWQDIALCVRSVKYNCKPMGISGSEKYTKFFYSELGIDEDKEKLRYYILLDELF